MIATRYNLVFLIVVSCGLMQEVATSSEPPTINEKHQTERRKDKTKDKNKPPNIIFMLADDMGWYNTPWNGNPEIKARMPHVSQLASEGVILDRHYSYKYCSPARSSLLSGRLPLHVTQNNKNNLVTNPGGADLRMELLPSVLKRLGGARTACIGKWHVGARSKANLPTSRGFDYHFGFLKGGQDHFSQRSDDAGVDFVDLVTQGAPAYGRNGTTYSTYMYAAEATRVIERHAAANNRNIDNGDDDDEKPLFLYLAWQAMHGPLEAPPEYIQPLPNDPRRARSKMNGMAAVLDEGVKNVTDALKRTGLYDNTLLIFSSDNGGWIQSDHGGNNYPLRGGKVTDFEGGVRAAAIVAGGYLEKAAPHLVGARSNLLIHLVDWYATLVGLTTTATATTAYASTTATDDSHSGKTGLENSDGNNDMLPLIDSVDFWQALVDPTQFNNVTAVRQEIPLAFCTAKTECDFPGGVGDSALISWPWKIINGTQAGLGLWQGPMFPNASKRIPQPGTDPGCPNGCLFNIDVDPNETTDLKNDFSEVYDQLLARLLEIGSGVYQTDYDGGARTCIPVAEAYQRDQGFLSPRCTVEGDSNNDDTGADKQDQLAWEQS